MPHLNIHSIIDENCNLTVDNDEKTRIAHLKSVDAEEIHLYKISCKSTQDQLSRLKDNLNWRIQTSVDTQEKTFLKAFNSIISQALIMKVENKDISHISLACHKEELPHFHHRDLVILNEINLFNNRISHQVKFKDNKGQKFTKKCLRLSIYLGQEIKNLFLVIKKGIIKSQYLIVKLKKIIFPPKSSNTNP